MGGWVRRHDYMTKMDPHMPCGNPSFMWRKWSQTCHAQIFRDAPEDHDAPSRLATEFFSGQSGQHRTSREKFGPLGPPFGGKSQLKSFGRLQNDAPSRLRFDRQFGKTSNFEPSKFRPCPNIFGPRIKICQTDSECKFRRLCNKTARTKPGFKSTSPWSI